MKSCSEMTADVFMRIEEYRSLWAKRKKLIARAVIPVVGICIAAMMLFTAKPEREYTAPLLSDSDKYENRIVINQIEGIAADRMYICLLCEDFVPMNREELTEYYGTEVFPSVPEDLKSWDEIGSEPENFGIFRREGGTGEVYHDVTVLNYSNEDYTRNINIEFAKGKFPFTCYGDFGRFCEMSEICGVEVGIGQSESGHYLVEFMYNNVGFRMITDGLSIEETEAVIESLIY